MLSTSTSLISLARIVYNVGDVLRLVTQSISIQQAPTRRETGNVKNNSMNYGRLERGTGCRMKAPRPPPARHAYKPTTAEHGARLPAGTALVALEEGGIAVLSRAASPCCA